MMEWQAAIWLLLPVAAASGWFAAQRSLQQRNSTSQFSRDYLSGLNYLLNEQTDKAIDVFVNLIEVDNETLETHLALGVMFRRRGEVNRAIRIHQNLLNHKTLSPQHRGLALLELGQDYQCAGLLDRAEDLFYELIKSGRYTRYAYQHLLDIYQQEHEWPKAIRVAEELQAISGEDQSALIAQYYCEQAEHYCQQGEQEKTQEHLRKALTIDPACVRASLVEGQVALKQNNLLAATRAFQRVEQQDKTYLSEIVTPLQSCYAGRQALDEFADYLRHLLSQHGGVTPMLTLAELLRQQHGEQEAADFVVEHLKQHPSIHGLAHFVELNLHKTEGSARETLLLLKDMTSQLLHNRPLYRCECCGFSAKRLYWQCPGCKQWTTVKPIQGIEGE
jgi:lipopolysaccharide biosynthesis regulator YciM